MNSVSAISLSVIPMKLMLTQSLWYHLWHQSVLHPMAFSFSSPLNLFQHVLQYNVDLSNLSQSSSTSLSDDSSCMTTSDSLLADPDEDDVSSSAPFVPSLASVLPMWPLPQHVPYPVLSSVFPLISLLLTAVASLKLHF